MAWLSDRPSWERVPFMRGMGAYFSRFTPGARNGYVRLFRWLKIEGAQFAVASLNYENLIEHALCRNGYALNGDGASEPSATKTILKPHGSCGFLSHAPGVTMRNVRSENTKTDMQISTRVELDREKLRQWYEDPENESLAPVMSYYAPGKHTRTNTGYVDTHRDFWRRAVGESDVCCIVGVRCNPADAHIWEPIAAAPCRLIFVNPKSEDQRAFVDWCACVSRGNATVWPKTFLEAIDDIVKITTRPAALSQCRPS